MQAYEYFVREIIVPRNHEALELIRKNESVEDSMISKISFDSDSDYYAICLLGVFDLFNEKYGLNIDDCEEVEISVFDCPNLLQDFDEYVPTIPEALTDFESNFLNEFRKLLELALTEQTSVFFIF